MTTVHAQMTVGEMLRLNRSAAPLLMRYGMHCPGCPHAESETLAQVCAARGFDVDELVEKLHAYLVENGAEAL